MPWTPYADLDELIEELLGQWRRILGDGLTGAWIQGSFALGAGDLHSDCDWIVATHAPLTGKQVVALRRLHDEIPTREGHWPHDIEGSYAPFDELASIEHLGRQWLFNDTGTERWSGATTATAVTPAGLCGSTASRSPVRSRGRSCLRSHRSCCAMRRRLRCRR